MMMQFEYSAWAEQGHRPHMEDRVRSHRLVDDSILVLLCDGHAGHQAADFVIAEYPALFERLQGDMVAAAKQVSDLWDQRCLSLLGASSMPITVHERSALFRTAHIQHYLNQGGIAGTTFVAAHIMPRQRQIRAINIGDSRMAWKQYGIPKARVRSTRDHKPKVKDLGVIPGRVVADAHGTLRVNGDLAVGRAIGDNTQSLMNTVTAVPDEYTLDLSSVGSGRVFRLVIASDGVWDVVSNAEAIKVRNATDLVKLAMKKGTSDNASAIVINFE